MKDQKLSTFILLTLLSFFGVGYMPKAPGTFGSLATIPLILWLAWINISTSALLALILILFVISSFAADKIQKQKNVQDPGWIVIDEVIGMLITWAFVLPSTKPLTLVMVFGIFRFFDIIKIFPANWCDKKIKSGMGTIIDDVVSGIYAGFCMLIINIFYPLV